MCSVETIFSSRTLGRQHYGIGLAERSEAMEGMEEGFEGPMVGAKNLPKKIVKTQVNLIFALYFFHFM